MGRKRPEHQATMNGGIRVNAFDFLQNCFLGHIQGERAHAHFDAYLFGALQCAPLIGQIVAFFADANDRKSRFDPVFAQTRGAFDQFFTHLIRDIFS